jgi:hypothetical protein
MGVRDKYDAIEDPDELIRTLEEDGMIAMEAPDPVSGHPLFTLTDLGNETFANEVDEAGKYENSRLSRETSLLWQSGMIEIEFHESNYTEDMVSLTPDAYDPEKVLLLPSDQQETLAVIKRSLEKKFESDL